MQYSAAKAGYENMWAKAKVVPQHEAALKAICKRFIEHRARYEAVEKSTGVPWWWIAIVHERESSCDFTTHLANGDPLNHKTVHVPAGRGPFATWEEGAIDALRYMGLDKITDWSLPSALFQFERYNGPGYIYKGVNSPYVWSFTNLYSIGKFGADGVYSPYLVDHQPGCAAMLNILLSLIPGLITQVIPMTQPAPTPTVTIPATTSNVVVNPLAQLGLNIVSMLGAVFASSHVDVGGVISTLSGGSFWGGILATVIPQIINHYITASSNKVTLAALAPQQQSLLQATAANPTPAA